MESSEGIVTAESLATKVKAEFIRGNIETPLIGLAIKMRMAHLMTVANSNNINIEDVIAAATGNEALDKIATAAVNIHNKRLGSGKDSRKFLKKFFSLFDNRDTLSLPSHKQIVNRLSQLIPTFINSSDQVRSILIMSPLFSTFDVDPTTVFDVVSDQALKALTDCQDVLEQHQELCEGGQTREIYNNLIGRVIPTLTQNMTDNIAEKLSCTNARAEEIVSEYFSKLMMNFSAGAA